MGPSIFVLWKAALLKKRILIYTPPPVETACLAGKLTPCKENMLKTLPELIYLNYLATHSL